MIQDLLDYVWVSDVGDDTHSSTTLEAQRRLRTCSKLAAQYVPKNRLSTSEIYALYYLLLLSEDFPN